MPLIVDEKEVAVVSGPNPVPGLAVKTLPGPQREEEVDLCDRAHSLFPPTLHKVNPLMSPATVHVKEKVPSGHVGGAASNCPVTYPEGNTVKHSDVCM